MMDPRSRAIPRTGFPQNGRPVSEHPTKYAELQHLSLMDLHAMIAQKDDPLIREIVSIFEKRITNLGLSLLSNQKLKDRDEGPTLASFTQGMADGMKTLKEVLAMFQIEINHREQFMRKRTEEELADVKK